MIMKGQKISDRYQIIKSIGEGGMANVYLAYDTILDRNVAVKVLRGDLANDEKFVRRFQREALSASSLSNPNIVEVYDVGEDNGEYYIVMEYVEGKHLKALLKKRGKLTVPEVIDIALQITYGLSVAHDSYIIHRDIKPQNILILENGLIKITDFGIAVAMNATQLTQTNSVMGSVHYLPPEQASGKGATLQSDIYSIGILMYELLTGKLPFRGDNAVEIALKHLKEPMPSIRDELPDIPQSVENIILRATAKNPKNRYSDAREMHEDLKTCLDESRANELKITFKYPENDYDDTKLIKTVKEQKPKVNKNEKSGDKEVAKKTKNTETTSDNKLLITLASVFVGLVVIITTIFVLIPKITSSKQTAIPDVSGYSVTDAIKALQDAGFVVSDEQREEANELIEEGKVSRTSPAIGSIRKEGTEVIIYRSLGDIKITIEDYKGKMNRKGRKKWPPLTPPGSISLERFKDKCTGCQICVVRCPSQVLRPTGLEYGLDYMLKPRLAYISSYCNYECTVCSDVCPTGAIKPLTIEEKTTTQVGIATFFKGRCVVNTEEKDCGACAEHCPTQAVHMVPYKGTLTIPQINPDLCIGCGGCESICPVRPMRAIIVKSNVEHKFVEKPKEEEIKEIEVDDFGF